MIVLRSFLSNLSIYAIIALGCILAVPLLLFPESVILKHIQLVAKLSSSISLRLAGIDLEIKGQDNIPKGAIIVASKHQSLWETQFLLGFFDNVAIVLRTNGDTIQYEESDTLAYVAESRTKDRMYFIKKIS